MSEIDVILPTYNNDYFLDRAILNIVKQEFGDFTFIIVNDGSTDNTCNILDRWSGKDSRIKVVTNEKNNGLPSALNIGHSNGCSPFCTWISTDNVSYSNHLSLLYNCIISGQYDFVQGNYIIKDNGVSYNRITKDNKSSWGYGNLCPAFLYRRLVWETYKYDEEIECAEDLKFYLQAYLHPFKFGYVDKYLVDYYIHTNSLTTKVHKDLKEHNKKLQKIYDEVIAPHKNRKI